LKLEEKCEEIVNDKKWLHNVQNIIIIKNTIIKQERDVSRYFTCKDAGMANKQVNICLSVIKK
jgi:hypothetical protein